MPGPHDRRSFFRQLLRGTAEAIGEVEAAVRGGAEEPADDAISPEPVRAADEDEGTVRADPATRCLSEEELRDACVDLGLEGSADEVAALARVGLRLTPGAGGSRLGGAATVTAGLAPPLWRGDELTPLLHVALDELPPSALPRSGSLAVLFALSALPDGGRADEADACRVVHVPEGVETAELPGPLPELALAATRELTLPVDPPASVEDVSLWAELRDRVAELQGIESEETSPSYHAVHRLLGHPDALIGGMELDAQLAANGIDPDGVDRYADERVPGLEPGADDWQLLAQLSGDDDVGVSFGPYRRLFVWIRRDDLAAGELGRVRAFVR